MNLTLDFDSLTIEEVELLEEISGVGVDAVARILSSPDKPKAKIMKAVAFVAARRTDPDITVEAVGRMPIAALYREEPHPPVPPQPASAS